LRVTVNGKPREIAASLSLLEFLQSHDINPALVAVEYNGEIVHRERFQEVLIVEGDRLEVVHMVGGGCS